ncbi:hypothetical protein NL108_013481, partial [Boleophthalmus pectinirostris]
ENQLALLVLHRLLDHGQARRVVLQARCPITLAWILHGRSSQTQHMPEKKTHTFALCWGPRKSSHEDQEPHLCICLSLLFLCTALFSQSAVVELSRALQEQSRAGGGVTQLSISTLPCPSLLEQLLEACPRLLSFSVEVHSIVGPSGARGLSTVCAAEFPLQKLSVSLNQQLFPRLLLPSLLQCCPQLCSLHVCGLRLQTGASYGQLITSLTECCGGLRCLSLEDVNLSDCLEHILLLLRHCQLHELCLKDCRLMEKWNNKEDSLQRLITALAAHNTLQSLSLAHNRIARHVPVLAQLFSAPRSVLQRLDL